MRYFNMGNPDLNFLIRQIQIENLTRCSLWQIRISSLVCRISFRTLEHSDFEFVSDLGFRYSCFLLTSIEYRVSSIEYPLISFQSQEVQKKCSKTVNFLQFLLKTRSFLQKNVKKCKKVLIFTPIFRLKTNKSYKITLFAIANHPIFQNFPQNPLFF